MYLENSAGNIITGNKVTDMASVHNNVITGNTVTTYGSSNAGVDVQSTSTGNSDILSQNTFTHIG